VPALQTLFLARGNPRVLSSQEEEPAAEAFED